MRVGIVGATGYSGVELIRILQNHPKFSLTALYTSSQQGKKISEQFPHLTNIIQHYLKEINPMEMAKETDLIFLATPSGVSTTLAPKLLNEGCLVIDLSGDFRIVNSQEYEKWYKKSAAPKDWVERAVYSIPELHRQHVKGANFISNPGCYPTAVLLGIAPLVKAGILREGSLIIDAKSGVSGAGRTASVGMIYSEINENLKIYKVNKHQHIPEIEQTLKQLGYSSPITFQTHLIPMTRGIMATIYASINSSISEQELWNVYKEHYCNEPFVRIRDLGNFPSTKEVYGSNYCDIGVSYDHRTNRVTIISVIDNLVKGAAGQAIQNANIMFGFEETEGLISSPLFP